MKRRSLLTATAAALAAGAARAQSPDRTLRIVVGFAPGGGTDRIARIIAEKLQARLGTPVVVENKTGAGGRLSAQQVRAAPPSQPTLLLANPAVMTVAPLVFKDSGYDPERDFTPVSQVNTYEFVLAVAQAVPVRELPHLLAWLRANPEKATFGVPATGSLPHFFALMMGEKANVRAEVVGYRGSAPLATDLIGGQVPVAFDTLEGMLPQHEAGKLRILAVSGAKRSRFAPSIPTFRESGIDLVASGWNAFFAPSTMPADRVDAYAAMIREVMQEPDTVQRFDAMKTTAVAASRAQTRAMLDAFRAQWAPVVTKAGLRP